MCCSQSLFIICIVILESTWTAMTLSLLHRFIITCHCQQTEAVCKVCVCLPTPLKRSPLPPCFSRSNSAAFCHMHSSYLLFHFTHSFFYLFLFVCSWFPVSWRCKRYQLGFDQWTIDILTGIKVTREAATGSNVRKQKGVWREEHCVSAASVLRQSGCVVFLWKVFFLPAVLHLDTQMGHCISFSHAYLGVSTATLFLVCSLPSILSTVYWEWEHWHDLHDVL